CQASSTAALGLNINSATGRVKSRANSVPAATSRSRTSEALRPSTSVPTAKVRTSGATASDCMRKPFPGRRALLVAVPASQSITPCSEAVASMPPSGANRTGRPLQGRSFLAGAQVQQFDTLHAHRPDSQGSTVGGEAEVGVEMVAILAQVDAGPLLPGFDLPELENARALDGKQLAVR